MEVRYIIASSNLAEKTLFNLSFRKHAYEIYYKPNKIEKCVGVYYFLRMKFDELLLKDFVYFSPEGYEKLKNMYTDLDLEKCFDTIKPEDAEMNILSAISDYRNWLTDNIKDISEIALTKPDSLYNQELAKHINYMIMVKLGKVDNLDFENYEGFKRFIQLLYFLSQKVDEKILEEMVFYSNLVISDLKYLYPLDAEKVLNFARLTAFVPSETDISQEKESHEYLTINFSLLAPYYSIDEILKIEEIRKLIDLYKEYNKKDNINVDFNTLDFIISVFVDKKEEYLKLKEIYYNLWKKVFSKITV